MVIRGAFLWKTRFFAHWSGRMSGIGIILFILRVKLLKNSKIRLSIPVFYLYSSSVASELQLYYLYIIKIGFGFSIKQSKWSDTVVLVSWLYLAGIADMRSYPAIVFYISLLTWCLKNIQHTISLKKNGRNRSKKFERKTNW